MPLFINNQAKEPSALWDGNRSIRAVYRGETKIWPSAWPGSIRHLALAGGPYGVSCLVDGKGVLYTAGCKLAREWQENKNSGEERFDLNPVRDNLFLRNVSGEGTASASDIGIANVGFEVKKAVAGANTIWVLAQNGDFYTGGWSKWGEGCRNTPTQYGNGLVRVTTNVKDFVTYGSINAGSSSIAGVSQAPFMYTGDASVMFLKNDGTAWWAGRRAVANMTFGGGAWNNTNLRQVPQVGTQGLLLDEGGGWPRVWLKDGRLLNWMNNFSENGEVSYFDPVPSVSPTQVKKILTSVYLSPTGVFWNTSQKAWYQTGVIQNDILFAYKSFWLMSDGTLHIYHDHPISGQWWSTMTGVQDVVADRNGAAFLSGGKISFISTRMFFDDMGMGVKPFDGTREIIEVPGVTDAVMICRADERFAYVNSKGELFVAGRNGFGSGQVSPENDANGPTGVCFHKNPSPIYLGKNQDGNGFTKIEYRPQ